SSSIPPRSQRMSSQEHKLEVGTYVGNALMSILYGADICMYLTAVYFLLQRKRLSPFWINFYIIYGGLQLLFFTVYVAVNQYFGQLMWIEHANTSGGPAEFFTENFNSWLYVLGSAVAVAANALGDGLMIYRCYIIWRSDTRVILFLLALCACMIVTSIGTTVTSAIPTSDFWKGPAYIWTITWMLSTGLVNVSVTGMICYKCIRTHREFIGIRALTSAMKNYTGLVAVMVEATVPYTVMSVAYAFSVAWQNGFTAAMSDVWVSVCIVCQHLIILRISMGLAWNEHTMEHIVNTCVAGASLGGPDLELGCRSKTAATNLDKGVTVAA
ncbi:hypothetical protein CONPUDRAFT_52872, partial [Coniophora puteana RWD-64-598 SS2]